MSDHDGTSAPGGVLPAAGWYRDPQGSTRWWDGGAWTGHVAAEAPDPAHAPTRTTTMLAEPTPTGPGQAAPAAGRTNPQGSLSRRTWLVAGAVVAIVALLGGYLLFGRGADDASPTNTTHFAPLTAAQKAAKINLKTSDLPPTLKVAPVPRGTALTGADSTSLWLCGGRFTSEAHRLARSNIFIDDSKGNMTGAQEETIVYASPTWAGTAMTEWNKAVAGCNQRVFKVYAENGKTAIRYSSMTVRPATGLPVRNSSETRFRIDVKGGQTYYGLVFLQQQGNTVDLMALYYVPANQAAVSAVTRFAQISGDKLLASSPGTATTAAS